MKIIAARTRPFRDPKASPGNGSGCLLELETNLGLMGIGIGTLEIAKSALRIAEDILISEDPRAVIAHWNHMCRRLRETACTDLDIQATAMLDMALWDLKAKANKEPLWKTLGGNRPRAFACVCAVVTGTDDESFRDRISSMVQTYGFRAGKLPVGPESDADLRRLKIMHKALAQNTPAPELLLSSADRWTPEQAISRTCEIEQRYDLVCIQGSPSAWGTKGLKQISEHVFAAVCNGEAQNSAEGLFTSLDHTDFDILTIDPAISGISGSLQMAEAAFGYELPVLLAACTGNTGAHLASVMPNVMYLEVQTPDSATGTVTSDVQVEDGWVVAGDEPGHGMAIAAEALE